MNEPDSVIKLFNRHDVVVWRDRDCLSCADAMVVKAEELVWKDGLAWWSNLVEDRVGERQGESEKVEDGFLEEHLEGVD